jgi:hypothetical protein
MDSSRAEEDDVEHSGGVDEHKALPKRGVLRKAPTALDG